MQIKEIIIYGYNGKSRRLHLQLGKLNIISGKSKSGKSSVGEIIDYCLGGTSCNIADGIVRDNSAWYALLLQLDNEQIFVARQNPDQGHQSTESCYIEIGDNLKIPECCDFKSNANVGTIENILSQHIGICDNINIPQEGQSRLPLSANIRHTLYYCFQGQDEMAAKQSLFHRQSEPFMNQAIKDTIPYFLGAVSDEALALNNELKVLKRKLLIEKRNMDEKTVLIGKGTEKAINLVGEARQVGLIDEGESMDYDDISAILHCFDRIIQWKPERVSHCKTDRLSFLQHQLVEKQTEFEEIGFSLDNAKQYIGESSGYYKETKHQKIRLESIGLFEKLNFETGVCPLCSGKLSQPLPSVEMIKTSIENLNTSIENISRETPKVRAFIDKLKLEREAKREEIKAIENEIEGIYSQEDEAKEIQDLNARKAKVMGRISLWMESYNNDIDGDKQNCKIEELEIKIQDIESAIDRESIEERKQSALSRIQADMTKWAEMLKLEYSGCPYRLDLNKVTVMVDKPDRPVPLKQLGSGANWVGVHLITLFALHKYFQTANRPVPEFIFLDQPSQVYFPSDSDENKTDWVKVNEMYEFIIERVEEAAGNLQVIIVDHAELENEKFYKLTTEDWWPANNNLIPKEWYIKE